MAAFQRPDHPDFARLSKILLEMDAESEEDDSALMLVLKDLADADSVIYVAEQRMLRLKDYLSEGQISEKVAIALMSCYLEGFIIGARFTQEKIANEPG